MTLQDMLDLLKSIPQKARLNYLRVTGPDGVSHDVTGLQFAQSEAGKWNFEVYVVVNDNQR